jgi:hypothetical protein
MKAKRRRTRPSRRKPKSRMFRPSVDDVLWWAKLNPGTMFSDAAREIKSLRGPVEVLWPKGAKKLTVKPLNAAPTKAVRKRTRRK